MCEFNGWISLGDTPAEAYNRYIIFSNHMEALIKGHKANS